MTYETTPWCLTQFNYTLPHLLLSLTSILPFFPLVSPTPLKHPSVSRDSRGNSATIETLGLRVGRLRQGDAIGVPDEG